MDGFGRRQDWHSSPSPSRQRERNNLKFWGEYALWVGNIPQQTTVVALRDYFSETNPRDLLSISYNPDAKYAFVNFGTDAARMAAIRLAASRLFEGKRLDCRIRRDSTSRSTKVNYGLNRKGPSKPISICYGEPADLRHKVEELSHFPESDRSQWGTEKYFIIKSFSEEALYRSLELGQWYVPRRHIERLNHAFQTSSKVYLLFSVNGSGSFFGYAAMNSEINLTEIPSSSPSSNDIHKVNSSPNSDVLDCESDGDDMEMPSLSRSRTDSLSSSDSSSGSIYYEPERRRIIWEASSLQTTLIESSFHGEVMMGSRSPSQSPRRRRTTRAEERCFNEQCIPEISKSPLPQTYNPWLTMDEQSLPKDDDLLTRLSRFSSPCHIKWLSTQKITFDEIRGLKNAWNSNKEIHIARNVTAVEPNSGALLVRLWKEKAQLELLRHSRNAIARAWPLAPI